MDGDDVNAARALMHGARSMYSTLLLLIRSRGSTARDNVKLTCDCGGPSYFDAVWFVVVTRKHNEEAMRVMYRWLITVNKSRRIDL